MRRDRHRRLAREWDARLARMLPVSAAVHLLAAAAVVALAGAGKPRPLPLTAYTVEITDPSALGGRLPPGAPGRDLAGGPSPPPAPAPGPKAVAEQPKPAPAPEAAPKPPEPKPTPEAAVKAEESVRPVEPAKPPAPPPEPAKAPEAPPQAAPKPEPAKPPAARPEAAMAKPEPKPVPTSPAEPKPAEPRPAQPKATAKAEAVKPAGAAAGSPSGRTEVAEHDAYAALAERWRQRAGGGGLGGRDAGSGPIGAGGEGRGGGGQLVGVEFLAYRQQVINTVKAQWTNVILRPGLVAAVRFGIAPDGTVSDVRLEQGSGNPAYDASVLRAVQVVRELPPPPARYVNEFREFVIEFHSEERQGEEGEG
jgi:TonB family protein